MSAIVGLMATVLAQVPASPATCLATTRPESAPPTAQMPVPASYELSRVRIPMRDGVCLDTFTLAPKATGHPYPILLTRTPYDPTSRLMSPESEFIQAGYLFVTQSARGRYGSEGQFVQMRPQIDRKASRTDIDESSDTFDTRTPAMLAIGPWTHGQWARDTGESAGPLHFGSATSAYFIRNIELPFFESYLKGDGRPNLPVAGVFDTGLGTWSSFDAWPPKQSVKASLYLGPHGSLSFAPPSVQSSTTPSYDEYVSDPANPVSFVPDHGLEMKPDYMTRDQRFSAGRSDVLAYESEVLTEDVTVSGAVSPQLVVSTSGTDSDWVVKLIDVHPDSASATAAATSPMSDFQELVRGDVMRSKFRKNFSTPEPMQPNGPTAVHYTMPDVYHTFRKGHRILVQVQSSWFPLVDLNPQRFEDIYSAKAGDFQRATQRVYHTAEYASRIELAVLTNNRYR
jgi:putative CocE/NonD family hydrolase